MTNVCVACVGMIPFAKHGRAEDWDVMAERAVRLVLDAADVAGMPKRANASVPQFHLDVKGRTKKQRAVSN